MLRKKKIVLIVEDDLSLLKVLSNKFFSENFEVLEARNGEEGLAMVLKKTPDIILLDIVMPKMDGLTMLKKLKSDDVGKNIPVIILSNLTDSLGDSELSHHDIEDYLVKTDWKIEDVVKKVKKILDI